jgi:hypothetical protein
MKKENRNNKSKQASRSGLKIVLGGVSLVIVLSFSGLFAGTANNPDYPKINSELGFNPYSDTVTKSFAVAGNGACKSSIEGLLTSNAGVLSASWDSVAQAVTVTFVWKTIHRTQLSRILAQAGYDNANARARDSAYAALPAACQYTRLTPSISNSPN